LAHQVNKNQSPCFPAVSPLCHVDAGDAADWSRAGPKVKGSWMPKHPLIMQH